MDTLVDVDMDIIGTKLLIWDMTLALLVIERIDKSKGKSKETPFKRTTPHLLIKEANPKEELIEATQ